MSGLPFCLALGVVRYAWMLNKWQAILMIYIGSVCYTIASFYHLSFGEQWTFWRAYALAIVFVSIEYIFNVIGIRECNRYISVFQIMILVIAFDLINLYAINVIFLKNTLRPWREFVSLALIGVAVFISLDAFSITPRTLANE
jgi:hypothetical protein